MRRKGGDPEKYDICGRFFSTERVLWIHSYRTFRWLIFVHLLLLILTQPVAGQVSVRIFAEQRPSSAVLTVTGGKYSLRIENLKEIQVMGNEPVILALYNGKIAVKLKNSESYICDSLLVRGLTGNDRFSFRINGGSQLRHLYSGDLKCLADLNTMVFINITDTEEYIAGVVRAEGGPGKNLDYLKSQAVLTRTFMYRHMHRHAIDRYNLCDNTHCQAFDGISDDSLIKRAVLETKDLVVLANDSTLIISAYHSNCGGETAEAEDVWLSGYPYLKKVNDPYCLNSRSAKWSKSIPLSEWESYLRKSGFIVPSPVLSYNFSQLTRMPDYKIGTFSLPFRKIRDDLYLRSSFFSVVKEGDSIVFKGRGYGHGVGLCQEGAKVMAEKGLGFSEIIKFYYTGVLITDVKNARIIKSEF